MEGIEIIINPEKRKRRRRKIEEEEHAIKGGIEKWKIPCAGVTEGYLLRHLTSRRIFGLGLNVGPKAHFPGISFPVLLLPFGVQWQTKNGEI